MAALLNSTNRLGGRRPVRAARRRPAALERGDAAIVELRALKRPALLRDALVSKSRVCAQQLFVLPALAHILLGAFAGLSGKSEIGGSHHHGGETARKQFRHGRALLVRGPDRQDSNKVLAEMRRGQSTIVNPPLTLNTCPVM